MYLELSNCIELELIPSQSFISVKLYEFLFTAADEAALGLGLLDEAGDLGGHEAAVADVARPVVGHARGSVLCEESMVRRKLDTEESGLTE